MTDEIENVVEGNSQAANIWKISIITSLIASVVFAIIFQPIINGAGRLLVSFVSSFANDFIDRSFGQAPAAVTNSIIFKFDAIFTALMLGVGVAIIFVATGLGEKLFKKMQSRPKIARRSKHSVFYRIGSSVYALVLIYAVTTSILSSYISIQASATFERTLMAISSSISDDEEEALKSRWALISSQKDYEDLLDEMERVAHSRSAKTPKRFI